MFLINKKENHVEVSRYAVTWPKFVPSKVFIELLPRKQVMY